MPGAAEGGIVRQEVQPPEPLLPDHAGADDVVLHDADEPHHLAVLPQVYHLGAQVVAAHRHVRRDDVQECDVDAHLRWGKLVPARQPGLVDERGVGQRVMHVVGAETGGGEEAQADARLGARLGGQVGVGAGLQVGAAGGEGERAVHDLDGGSEGDAAGECGPEGVVEQGQAECGLAVHAVEGGDSERARAVVVVGLDGQRVVAQREPLVEEGVEGAAGVGGKGGGFGGGEGEGESGGHHYPCRVKSSRIVASRWLASRIASSCTRSWLITFTGAKAGPPSNATRFFSCW